MVCSSNYLLLQLWQLANWFVNMEQICLSHTECICTPIHVYLSVRAKIRHTICPLFLPILYPTKTFHPNNFPVHVCIVCIYTLNKQFLSAQVTNICFTQPKTTLCILNTKTYQFQNFRGPHFCSNSEVACASNRLFIIFIGSYHHVLIIHGRRVHLISERISCCTKPNANHKNGSISNSSPGRYQHFWWKRI